MHRGLPFTNLKATLINRRLEWKTTVPPSTFGRKVVDRQGQEGMRGGGKEVEGFNQNHMSVFN